MPGPPGGKTVESSPGYPGETLGLPRTGPGSLAPMGRRLMGLLIDWLIAYGLASLGLQVGVVSPAMLSTVVLVVWLVLGMAAVRLFGVTPGQLFLRIEVVSVNGRPAGIGRLMARGLLIGLVIPPLFTDSDGRGLQDRVTHLAVVRR